MDIELATNDPLNGVALWRLRPAEGDAFQCEREVRSGGFTGRVPFCPERFSLEQFLAQVREMDRSLSGEALLIPMWEREEYVRLVLERTGSIMVSGELGWKELTI